MTETTGPNADLSIEQLRDLSDAKLITIGSSSTYDDPDQYTFFDSPLEYLKALEEMGYENPPDALAHELSHGLCAQAVGVKTVRYAIVNQPHDFGDTRLWLPRYPMTVTEGPVSIPQLALAAIKAAPNNPSRFDLAIMHKLLYWSVEYLEERITKWNRQDTGLTIPLPGTIDISS